MSIYMKHIGTQPDQSLGLARSYRCKILYFSPRAIQGGPTRAGLGLYLNWG